MKKFLVAILAVLILVGLTACVKNGEKVSPTEPPESTPVATPEPTAEPTPEPTAEPTPEPTAEPTPESTPEPTPEPTPAPTPKPTPKPTSKPTEPEEPEEPVDPEAAKVYTCRIDGQETKIILKESSASVAVVESDEMPPEDLAQMGLTGDLRMTLTQSIRFNSVSVSGSTATLSNAAGGYMSAIFEGSAAEAYKALVKTNLDAALAAGQMEQALYDMQLALLNGEEVAEDSVNMDNVTIVAELLEPGLISSILMGEGDNATKYTFEYADGVLTRETCFVMYSQPFSSPYAEINTYYPDGITVKTTERYYIQQNPEGEWELDGLDYTLAYRQDGTLEKRTDTFGSSTTVTEYNEQEIPVKAETYDADGNVTAYKDYYEDGTLKKEVRDNGDGTQNISEYYPDGSTKFEQYYNNVGDFYLREYYENGQEKRVFNRFADGTENETEYYENGQVKKETEYYDEDNWYTHAVIEYYESGQVQKKTLYLQDGRVLVCEYRENGETIRDTTYDAEGNLLGYFDYAYVYYDDGKLKSLTITDTNGDYYASEEYEYHENGQIKKEVDRYATGDRYEWEYFENGELKSSAGYDADGAWSKSEYYENGQTKYYESHEADGSWDKCEYYENGQTMRYEERNADDSGHLWEYYENGNHKKSVSYGVGGVEECVWEYYENGDTKYYESHEADGSGYREEYDENGNTIEETHYGAGGEIESVWTYEYEYNQDGSVKKYLCYENGEFYFSEECEYYADGTIKTETRRWNSGHWALYEYYESGNPKKTTYYNENNEPTSVIEYDEEGNPL